MAITPIEDLFTHRLHQSYNRSMRVAGFSENIPRRRYKVAYDAVNLLKRPPLLLGNTKIRQLLLLFKELFMREEVVLPGRITRNDEMSSHSCQTEELHRGMSEANHPTATFPILYLSDASSTHAFCRSLSFSLDFLPPSLPLALAAVSPAFTRHKEQFFMKYGYACVSTTLDRHV